MRNERCRRKRCFQHIAQGGSDTTALIGAVDIQPVEITGGIHIAQADDLLAQHRNKRVVRPKRTVPGSSVRSVLAANPGVDLRPLLVRRIHGANRIAEKADHLRAVMGLIGTY